MRKNFGEASEQEMLFFFRWQSSALCIGEYE